MSHPPTSVLIILGDQLFDHTYLPPASEVLCVMIEDYGLCTHVKHHQQKILLFLLAMRAHARSLTNLGYNVVYKKLTRDSPKKSYEDLLEKILKESNLQRLIHFEIEDHFFDRRIQAFAQKHALERVVLQSPMFMNSREDFATYLRSVKKPFMKTFYEKSRLHHNILVDQKRQPMGGRWSFDADNRRKLPKELLGKQSLPKHDWDQVHQEDKADVSHCIKDLFSSHPGDLKEWIWPTTRLQAQQCLDQFFKERLFHFGPYEDALEEHEDILFHSMLSPMMNLGLLMPQEVISKLLEFYQRHPSIPIQSVEAFVRQVVGWREFVRGIYHHFDESMTQRNFFGHERKLSAVWYQANSGIPPLDAAISRVLRLGYTHHIERLMVLGCLMLLCEIRPTQAHAWFMEMFVDSADWVMGPNVYGMALFSDGGTFATKPYICGSNYILKMSHYSKGTWCNLWDGLYWNFVHQKREILLKNPRTSMSVRTFDNMSAEKRSNHLNQAAKAISILTAG